MNTARQLAVALLVAALALPAVAQQYPTRPVSVVVPFTPGGSSDITARTVSAKLQESLGQSFVIDNKAGANGSLGAKFVAAAQPDGYTLFVGSIGVFAINPVLYKDLGYDPVKDYDLLSVAVRTPNALVTRADFPANTLSEFVAYVKKNPGKVSFASSGTGSSDHLTAALFWQKTGTSGIHVPYKGGSAAHLDIIAGNADCSFQNLGSITQHVKGGKMKLLAVTGDKRDPAAPNTPTLTEAGRARHRGLFVAGVRGAERPAPGREGPAAARAHRGHQAPRRGEAFQRAGIRGGRQLPGGIPEVPERRARALETGSRRGRHQAKRLTPAFSHALEKNPAFGPGRV
jgi:tripartite-type tricarboxylate transporter receptor subunit TctC